VKWGKLHIQFVDRTFQKIESCEEIEDDCKHPVDTEIEEIKRTMVGLVI
jgi:hypothetical protein